MAKDISGFEKASFSLFDYENQCEIADNGYDESQVGQKSERDEFNIRSLNISIGQCGSVAIHLKFETSEDLKNFEDQAKEFFSDLKKIFIFKESHFSGMFIYNANSELTSTDISIN